VRAVPYGDVGEALGSKAVHSLINTSLAGGDLSGARFCAGSEAERAPEHLLIGLGAPTCLKVLSSLKKWREGCRAIQTGKKVTVSYFK
jgi:hypothetical protein